MKNKPEQWTVVQHSAFGYKGDPQFYGGLESRPIDTKQQLDRVQKHGGMVFEHYINAEDFATFAMYHRVTGLTPRADSHGIFAKSKLDGLAIYQPTEGIKDDWHKSK